MTNYLPIDKSTSRHIKWNVGRFEFGTGGSYAPAAHEGDGPLAECGMSPDHLVALHDNNSEHENPKETAVPLQGKDTVYATHTPGTPESAM